MRNKDGNFLNNLHVFWYKNQPGHLIQIIKKIVVCEQIEHISSNITSWDPFFVLHLTSHKSLIHYLIKSFLGTVIVITN